MLNKKIKFSSLEYQHKSLNKEILHNLKLLLKKNDYILGEEVKNFEKKFAQFIGTQFSVGVGNGTDALEILLEGIGIGKGDEVIVPSLSYVATASAVLRSGATPIFVDVDFSGNLSVDQVETKLTSRTKAVLAVHLYGNPCNILSLRSLCKKNNLKLIEDAAQAHGANVKEDKVGTFGIGSAFSFYPGKNLGAIGDAGIICSNSEKLIRKCMRLRNHGRLFKFDHEIIGRNSRLDSIHAAVLNIKLNYLEKWNKTRVSNANYYLANIFNEKVKFLEYNRYGNSVFHQFVILVKNKKQFCNMLNRKGIEFGFHYPYIIPELSYLKKTKSRYPNSKKIANYGVSIPVGEHLNSSEKDYIIDAINLFN